MTVLLGATQAGKTSLMRLMAGLDTPTAGKVLVDGKDVTGVPVRERNVAMVYQQFINYPSLKVADNIGSPLKLRGEKNVDARVRELADKLHIGMFLDRYPAELSGGQQQRVALARALAKNAPLMLLDEPLVNLDYKLREGLREELTQLFASRRLHRHLRHHRARRGAAARRLHRGDGCRRAAAVRADRRGLPCAAVAARGARLQRPADEPAGRARRSPAACSSTAARCCRWRCPPASKARSRSACAPARSTSARARATSRLPGKVELAEISGSDTFVHVETLVGELVAQLTGVHRFELGARDHAVLRRLRRPMCSMRASGSRVAPAWRRKGG